MLMKTYTPNLDQLYKSFGEVYPMHDEETTPPRGRTCARQPLQQNDRILAVAAALADILSRDNPNFNWKRFLKLIEQEAKDSA